MQTDMTVNTSQFPRERHQPDLGRFFRIATFTTLTLNVANMMYGSWYRRS